MPDPGHRLHTTLRAAAADPSPIAAGIVLACNHERGRFNLVLKPAGAAAVTLLTDDPADERFPAPSPDGRTLAFASNAAGSWDVYTAPLDRAGRAAWTAVAATDEWELHPAWSPDGAQLAWCALARADRRWKVRVRGAGGAIREVGEGFAPAWHPSRDVLAIQRERGAERGWGIAVLDLRTGEVRDLGPAGRAGLTPAWSPDGRWIVYAEVPVEDADAELPRGDLWAVSLDGTTRRQLTRGEAAEWSPAFGGDGRVYYCREGAAGEVEIWSLEPGLE